MTSSNNKLAEVLVKREREIADKWLQRQSVDGKRSSAAEEKDANRKSLELMGALRSAAQTENLDSISGPAWIPSKDILTDLSSSRAKSGYSPSETAAFIFSLKPPLISVLREELSQEPEELVEAMAQGTELLDKLGLFTMEAFQKTREDIISRQQEELLELSTPVVRLWDNVLALPLIGTLDSARTQIVMQNLLEAIVETRSDFAIIDITGVPTVDTLVAQHLLKTVAAARLMGADCLISGIRPQIAQTIIHLGVDLSNVTTKATLADAFAVALARSGQKVVRDEKQACGCEVTVERISILKMKSFLLVTIQEDMHDRLALALQDDLTAQIVKHHAQGVLIDISTLEMVDSFIGRMLGSIAGMARLLDANTVVVGMQPSVAITLVELGLSLKGIRTALDVEKGMLALQTATSEAHDGEDESDQL